MNLDTITLDADCLKKAVETAYRINSVAFLMGYLASSLGLDGEAWLEELQEEKRN